MFNKNNRFVMNIRAGIKLQKEKEKREECNICFVVVLTCLIAITAGELLYYVMGGL